MSGVRKRFDHPDETTELRNAVVAGVELAESAAAKATFQTGWRWSVSVKPIVGGKNCQQHHAWYVLSERCTSPPWTGAKPLTKTSRPAASDKVAEPNRTTSEPPCDRGCLGVLELFHAGSSQGSHPLIVDQGLSEVLATSARSSDPLAA